MNPNLTVFVAGGASNTGSATIQHLLKSYPNVSIVAGVRNRQKATKTLGEPLRLSIAEHDIKPDTKPDSIDLKGVDTLLLVPPQAYHDRSTFAKVYIDAAKKAGVKHIVTITAPIAGMPNMIFGKGLHETEQLIKASGIPATYLHPLLFWENHMLDVSFIKSKGEYYYPAKNNVPVGGIGVTDIGAAAATVIAQGPGKHANKTYTLAAEMKTWDEVAAVYSKVLGKPIKFVPVSDDVALKAFTGLGLPEIFVKGFAELLHLLDTGVPVTNDELKGLIAREPETFEKWLSINAAAFK